MAMDTLPPTLRAAIWTLFAYALFALVVARGRALLTGAEASLRYSPRITSTASTRIALLTGPVAAISDAAASTVGATTNVIVSCTSTP